MYSSELKLEEIKAVIESLHRPGLRFLPTNKVLITKIEGSEIGLNGIAFRAKGTIIQIGTELRIKLSYSTIWTIKFMGILVLFFPIIVLFGDKVTLNGNANPDVWDRLLFASILLACFALVKLWLGHLKNEFIKNIERDLKLKPS